jgi:hypothetical protein
MSTPTDLSTDAGLEGTVERLVQIAKAAYDEGFNDGADVEQGVAAAPAWEETRAYRDIRTALGTVGGDSA